MAKAPAATRKRSSPNWGGRRAGGPVARFTAQLVALVTADHRDRVEQIAKETGASQAAVLRAVIGKGLPLLETGLKDGSVSPESLA